MPDPERFEVWWTDLPRQDGTHQHGRRPSIIVSNAKLAGGCIVVPLTTNLSRRTLPFTQAIEPTPANGLRQRSVALIFQLRYLDRRFLKGRAGELDEDVAAALDASRAQVLGFE